MPEKKLVILGAGLSGLSTAWKVAESGRYQVIVIDKASRVGGVSGSFQRNGYTLDYGPHKIYTQLPGIMEEIRSLLGSELLEVPKKSRLRLNGKFFSYPFRLQELLLGLNPAVAASCFLGYAKSSIRNLLFKNKVESYADYVVQRFGYGLYELTFRPMAQKIWGDPRKISYKLAEIRVPNLNLKEFVMRLLGKKKKDPTVNAEVFYYPKNGIQELSTRMTEEIAASCGKISLNSKPVEIVTEKGMVTSVKISINNRLEEIKTDYLVSTIPVTELAGLIKPPLSNDALEAAGRLQYRALVLVYLFLNKDRVSDDNWIFFPEEKYIFNRLFEQKGFSPHMVPPDKTAVCLDFTCLKDDEIWRMPESELLKTVISQLEETRLVRREDIEEGFTMKIGNVYPLYDLEFDRNLTTILREEEKIENLLTNGRLGLFNYNNMDHCIDMGIAAARHILSGKRKSESWAKEKERFSLYRIVD